MSVKDLKNIVDISTDAPTLLRVDVKADNWIEKVLQKLKIRPRKRIIEVYPIRLGSRERYSLALAKAKEFNDKNGNLSVTAYHNKASLELTQDVIEAISIALHNKKTNPPTWLKNTVREFNQAELSKVIEILNNHLQVENFLTSIISMTGMSLKTEEIIAFEKDSTFGSSKETSLGTGDSQMKK